MKVVKHKSVTKYISKLDSTTRGRLNDALKGLEYEPPKGDIKPLVGRSPFFRLKIGAYRAIFFVDCDIIKVTDLAPRGQVYNNL